MKKAVGFLLKLAALLGIVAALAKGRDLFRGAPETVGEDGFAFDEDDADPYAIDEATLGGEVDPELLERLVCPLDKGPLELVDGKWLVNPRNGFRYTITDGIPVMLVEVGERYRDAAFAAS